MEFVLIRHTRCDIEAGTCYGQLDVPLPAGTVMEDIEQALARAPTVDQVFSSPSQRCHLLAQALAKRDGCALSTLPDLRELNFGQWEGVRWSEVPRSLSDEWTADTWNRSPPGGESECQMSARVERALREVLRASMVSRTVPRAADGAREGGALATTPEPPGGARTAADTATSSFQRIAIVAHGGPLRLLRCLLTATPLSERWSQGFECGEVVHIECSPQRLTALRESACPSSGP